ncbi:hypothetical protein ASG89_17210 [Paenibacillus sp. Soil766]|uniref:hypothetical protein n=1 Tax=Paenibacillus sp. Soil766 TaxID=1736404 RepID=UPI00070DE20B|nr:hypothetical protein [Paenibacillus sp. Soil766]KRF07093.1 hypothetical protein ASG89_17210 [Paenibacillus sp. Soil766]
MRIQWFLFVVIMVIILICFGCGKGEASEKPRLTVKQLEEFYPGDISNVDHIEIRSGSTGALKIVNDKQLVQEWLAKVRHMKLTPDPNQEGRVGYLFYVDLFEGQEKKLRFLPNEIAGNYYVYSEELAREISELVQSK